MTRTFLLTLTGVAALLTGSANAADMYGRDVGGYKDSPSYYPVNTWTGFYVGANVGYGWQGNGNDYNAVTKTNGNPLDATGAFGGGQLGYNWQHDRFVIGIETDFEGSGISDKNATTKSNLNYVGTVRGRLGYTYDRALIYGTGGFAYGEVEKKAAGVSSTDTQSGYVIGAGLEYKLNPAWSLKGEYQYIDLDAKGSSAGSLGGGTEKSSEINTVRFGVNYHFGHGYEPLK